ncbi:protein FAM214A isoform X2 [Nilaparvata lugens]|nr:protein FAM214A isoform X2 [Nilaparvata lugens]
MHAMGLEGCGVGEVEAFVQLGTLIVEGRLASPGTQKGYSEGCHCPSSTNTQANRNKHVCLDDSFLCERVEKLRKHMSLLCANSLPMCVEVLLCADCQCGREKAQSSDIAVVPSPNDLLLERWTVSLVKNRSSIVPMTINGLLQAVRSQLHFSQLSAWWSSSRGQSPQNVCYRLTLPEQAFSSQFSRQPIEHSFPLASVNRNLNIKVSVQTLPRSETMCIVSCPVHCEAPVRKRSTTEQPLLGDPRQVSSNVSRRSGTQRISRPAEGTQSRTTGLPIPLLSGLVDDRMQTGCEKTGKHHCSYGEEDLECSTDNLHSNNNNINNNEEKAPQSTPTPSTKKFHFELSQKEVQEVLTVLRTRTPSNINNLSYNPDFRAEPAVAKYKQHPVLPKDATAKADLLLSAILRTSKKSETNSSSCEKEPDKKQHDAFNDLSCVNSKKIDPSVLKDDFRTSKSLVFSDNKVDCRSCAIEESKSGVKSVSCPDTGGYRTRKCWKKKSIPDENRVKCKSKSCSEQEEEIEEYLHDLNIKQKKNQEQSSRYNVPTALDKAKFRQSLDSAASMVFHSRTGLPLTSSPAPLRRVSQRFDFDSSINCVSAISSALYEPSDRLSVGSDDTEGEIKSPCSPSCLSHKQFYSSWPHHSQIPSSLLGSFEESVLNGRLEPVSTVHGFTADLSASGSFCPPHLVLPVTVFFYTLGDNDKVSTPYLGHINLGKKGYSVPRSGTIQVTLLNPLGTVIKMFVVMYDLSDMPNNSCTFLRQRTLYMPASADAQSIECAQKYLRYLIHLRFSSSKSGRISLHSDIRMIIFRKSDMDTANGFEMAYELRSFTHAPQNPKFSSRK